MNKTDFWHMLFLQISYMLEMSQLLLNESNHFKTTILQQRKKERDNFTILLYAK